jgi:hypothetical protein
VRRQKSRWEEDNDITLNWGAILAAALLVLGLVGLAALLALV